jgi:hypothetical protein
MHTVQIAGVQVRAFLLQVHPRAGTRPPPLTGSANIETVRGGLALCVISADALMAR